MKISLLERQTSEWSSQTPLIILNFHISLKIPTFLSHASSLQAQFSCLHLLRRPALMSSRFKPAAIENPSFMSHLHSPKFLTPSLNISPIMQLPAVISSAEQACLQWIKKEKNWIDITYPLICTIWLGRALCVQRTQRGRKESPEAEASCPHPVLRGRHNVWMRHLGQLRVSSVRQQPPIT